MGTKVVRAIVAIGVAGAVAGTAAVAPAAAGKPLTKKRALKLFYTKAEADGRFLTSGQAGPMFLDQAEADARYLQGQGTVVSLATDEATTDAGEESLDTPPVGRIVLDCAANGTPLVVFENQSGAPAVVFWDLIRFPSTANQGFNPSVADGTQEGPGTDPGPNDLSMDFEILAGGHVVTASVGADEGADNAVCSFVAQAVIDRV